MRSIERHLQAPAAPVLTASPNGPFDAGGVARLGSGRTTVPTSDKLRLLFGQQGAQAVQHKESKLLYVVHPEAVRSAAFPCDPT